MQDDTVLAFGDFRLRVDPATLYRRGRLVRLQGQPLRLLALLAGRAGQLVTHNEIKRHLWHDHIVDFAGGTHVCMRQVRSALGEDAGEPRYIETVARHGYRFVAPVRIVPQDEPVAVEPEMPLAVPFRRPGIRHVLALSALLSIAAVVSSSVQGGRLPSLGAAAAAGADPRVRSLYENAKQLANYDQRDRHILATSLLQRALSIDPAHGPTHALLADLVTQHGAAYLGIEGARETDLVRHHLRTASRHGADESNLLVTRGRQLLYGERRLGQASEVFRRAIDTNPANPAAWQLSSETLYLQSKFDEALRASLRAEELSADPNGVLWDRLQIYYLSGQFDELFALHDRLNHVQKTGAITIGVAMELAGRHGEAFEYIVDALRHRGILIGDATEAQQSLAAGAKPVAYRWLLSEIRKNDDPPLGGKGLAILQSLAGDQAGAAATIRDYVRKFERMEEGTHVDCLCFLTLRLDPFFRRLQNEPLVREAWIALDATIARDSAPATAVVKSHPRSS